MRKTLLLLAGFANLTIATYAQTDDYSPEERALLAKGAVMEQFSPNEPSGHHIEHITEAGPKGHMHKIPVADQAILCIVFGQQDAAPARAEGKDMAAMHYTPQMAQQFLFAEGWEKYHDRFFTRAYVQVGMEAFEANR